MKYLNGNVDMSEAGEDPPVEILFSSDPKKLFLQNLSPRIFWNPWH